MNNQNKSSIGLFIFLLISIAGLAQQAAFNQNSARSNHPKALQGFNYQLTPQYALNLKGKSIDSVFFRGNGGGLKMNAGYSFGNFGIDLTSGFITSQTDKTKIIEFISRNGGSIDNLTINTGNQQNMYFLIGPSAEFGNKITAGIHAKGGLFINNSGLVSIQRKGASFPVYRNEPSSKSVFPGFSAGINLNYAVSDLISIGFNTDFLSTKSEVVNYDQRRINAQGIVGEGLKFSKNITNVLAGISIKYSIKSPRDAASGQSAGKQIGKPQYGDIKSAIGSKDRNAATAQYNSKEVQLDKKTYQPGKPIFGNRTASESCGPVTKKITQPDGTTEEMIFACPEDAAQFERISMNVTVPKQTQGATFGEKVNQGLHAAGSALAQGRGIVSGKVTWGKSNSEVGIVTNQTIGTGNDEAARTTPNSSFGTMVRMSAREKGSGMASGRIFEPVYTEGQMITTNSSILEISNPVYTGGMSGTGNNPMYQGKAKIELNKECSDDNNSSAISGLKVLLTDAETDQVIAVTQTEKCGDFFFANVPEGNYFVQLSGIISGKKGYDAYMKSKSEVEGQIVWDGQSVNLILYNNDQDETPVTKAGISTSRSNLRSKSITIIDADTDGDGSFDRFKAIETLSDGSSRDILDGATVSRVSKVDAFTIKQKTLNNIHQAASKKASSSLQLTGIVLTNEENNKFKATATFSDGTSFDVTKAVGITSSTTSVKQFSIIVGDLDGDGNADAVAKITKSRSNIQNNRILKDDEDGDQELGVIKAKTKSNQSNDRMEQEDDLLNDDSNLSSLSIIVGDLDGDGKAELNNDGGVVHSRVNTSRSNIKQLAASVGDSDGDGTAEFLIGGSLPGGAVISATLRSPGDPIPGWDVKFSKKGSGNERKILTDANGKINIIGPDLEPDIYMLTFNNTIYIEDATYVTVRGWNPVKKEMIESSEHNTKAQDHNSSRSNKTASVIDNDQNSGNTKAQDHNSSRSNKTASIVGGNTNDNGTKWTATETTRSAINSSTENLEKLSASLDELELLLNADNIGSKSLVNTSRSNIKSQRAAISTLQYSLSNMEAIEKTTALKVVKSNMNSLNSQMSELQNLLKQLDRQYTTVSNVLKTKHDTAKNSVGNIR